jgi:hypothetical protein
MRTVDIRTNEDATATLLSVVGSWAGLLYESSVVTRLGYLCIVRVRYAGKRYILHKPLECAVTWEGEDTYYYAIRYRPFELNANDH